ncbi:type I-C CRISPR-associated protein Cas7/Csd2 [Marinithermus hydrothermalis]|uniref:CRISPR-associated protein, Csd2 family n=1 Tax=Marinithermus hydrothermalis (strain DSM 14884 / JCM 11576 / T1) TaxID=869210 RepID=F2NNM3_MARHT|nr:type I-C CRISPR-associated protein Cas7/Csd2 [Marinithermus hydrothermalis]AEB11038.1 CRISPR-associated protein, Csd2 family [Marinithermus hydrothermalis DSM 14884]
MSELHLDPTKRHEFVLLFDVKDGNPNGDPDAGNMPRVDPETMQGIVTDVALKRKVRDYVTLVKQNADGYRIFIQSESALNALIEEAAQAIGTEKNSKRPNKDLQAEMLRRYYDIRMFGAVLTTGDYNAGQVRGPLQFTFARSLDPVLPLELTITRKARTTEERMESGETEMGKKPLVPYGLYRAHGFYNPFLAGGWVSRDDLALFWEALQHLFDFDRSASRGEMHVRGLCIFSHENPKGNAPAHKLFELIRINRKTGVEAPRCFNDYTVEIGLPPSGVTLTCLVDPRKG